MSRSFGDNLTKEDVKTIADVRRDVWTSGFKGIGYGSATGYILHTTTRFIHNNILNDATRKKLKAKNIVFNRNTAFFSVMAGGALGSFLLATSTGKNEVHQMHDIFEIGKHDSKSPYQQVYERSKLQALEEDAAAIREKRRLSRKISVNRRLTEGQGLSDSHSGIWLDDEREGNPMTEDEKRRSVRRVTMSKRMDESQGLSSSRK